MSCNFNTFLPKNDQKLVKDYLDSYSGRYTQTKEWMFRFVCWLKHLDGEYHPTQIQTAIKTGTKALAIFGMLLLCPFVIGGFLLNWYNKAHSNIESILNDLRKLENEEFEKIVCALGVEKQGIEIPNLDSKPNEENIEDLFRVHQTPIFQCNGNFIALWIQDKERKENRRIVTIEKTSKGWAFKKLKSSRRSECHIASGVSDAYYRTFEFGSNIGNLKDILKGKDSYDELVLDLIRKPREKPSLGGQCITETLSQQNTEEDIETKKLIAALGGSNAVKKIPTLQKRPISKDRLAIFEQLKSPIFQCNGNFLAILIQNKKTQEHRIVTLKKANGTWRFKNFPLNFTLTGISNFSSSQTLFSHIQFQWLLEDGSFTTKTMSGHFSTARFQAYIEFLEEVVGVSTNQYALATF